MTRFLPDGRKPTRRDLEMASLSNVTIHACLQLSRAGDLTEEEALILAVLSLAEQNHDMLERLVDQSWRVRTVYLDGGKAT